MIDFPTREGIITWTGSGQRPEATAVFGELTFILREKAPTVSNECTITASNGQEIASSTRKSSFLKGITETLLIDGQASGLVLKRGMINTKVEWNNETQLLAFGLEAKEMAAEDTGDDDEVRNDDEDQPDDVEARGFELGGIRLAHADFSSEIHATGETNQDCLMAAFLAFRIWAKNYEGTNE